MANNQNSRNIIVNLVQIAPALVHLMSMLFSKASGAEKKAAAIEAGKQITITAGEVALAANPKFAEHYGTIIQAAYDVAKGTGTLNPDTNPIVAPGDRSGAPVASGIVGGTGGVPPTA